MTNLLANSSASFSSVTTSIVPSVAVKKRTGQDGRLSSSRSRPWVPSQYDLISAALAASCSFVHCTSSTPRYDDICSALLCTTYFLHLVFFYLIFFHLVFFYLIFFHGVFSNLSFFMVSFSILSFFILSFITTCHVDSLGIYV